jgi:hypothetical protein
MEGGAGAVRDGADPPPRRRARCSRPLRRGARHGTIRSSGPRQWSGHAAGSEGQEEQADDGHGEDETEREVEDGRSATGGRRPDAVLTGVGHGDHDRTSRRLAWCAAVFTALRGAAAPPEGVTGAAASDALGPPARWTVSATAIPRAGSARAATTQTIRRSRGRGSVRRTRRAEGDRCVRGGDTSATRIRASTVIPGPP